MKFGDLYIGKYVLLKGDGLTPDELACVVSLDVPEDGMRPWTHTPGPYARVSVVLAPVVVQSDGTVVPTKYAPGYNIFVNTVKIIDREPGDVEFPEIAEVPWAYEEGVA